MIHIFCDGASNGNPGFSGIGFIIEYDNAPPFKFKDFIGIKTNNEAEYTAVIRAMMFASSKGYKEVTFHSDSQLVIKQLNGEYRVKSQTMKELWIKIQNLRGNFSSILFEWKPRLDPMIIIADGLSHEALEKISSMDKIELLKLSKNKVIPPLKGCKNLLIKLTMKEYSDFWYVGGLLGVTKKKDILLGLIEFLKKFKEKNE